MATPKRKKTARNIWQLDSNGLQYINYNGAKIIKRKGSYSAQIKEGVSFSAKSLHDARTAIDAYKRSKETPKFVWQIQHPVEGWAYSSYMLGAIKRDRFYRYTYTTDHRTWKKATSLADAQQKIKVFFDAWMKQFRK